jgi:hypothetical protein
VNPSTKASVVLTRKKSCYIVPALSVVCVIEEAPSSFAILTVFTILLPSCMGKLPRIVDSY